jgi:hypothetical protein
MTTAAIMHTKIDTIIIVSNKFSLSIKYVITKIGTKKNKKTIAHIHDPIIVFPTAF